MCNYCNFEKDFNDETLLLNDVYTFRDKNDTIIREVHKTMGVGHTYNKDGSIKPSIIAEIWDFDTTITTMETPINFCPMCGRKLES